ncbi:hydrogen peroxide-inducible genes activator [Altericroceibacterium spongiae]|uniref:Hydrogen peroxide-inducible genes activator n=1 Tax=Altericroceibacterium spongiae TaxID=2320269 RepID=A0A420EJ02_9SPHN|nr:hydrogen peroxide-inducible genes activator [Altericroceibacterium spongiae]RKF20644.1 hydrogen peroxide-inducible genes activator [Altericroceibacterium spongiae]
MPTLRQLEYLVAIADTQHFGRAAIAANVSQPTLSQQLRHLETRLGVTLIERSSNPIQLTPVGREITDRARRMIVQADDIRALAKRSVSGMAGSIRFGVTPTLGPYLMPAVIAGLHRAYPELRLLIREGIPDEQLAELRRGALDMLLAPMPIGGTDVHIEPLFRESLYVVAASEDPLCSHSHLAPTDLAGQPVLSLDPRHHFHRQTKAICAELNADLLDDYEGTSLDSLRQMAGSGLGLAILPELYLRSEAGGEATIKRLTIRGWSAERSLAAIWREGAAFSENYQHIADAIATEAHRIMKSEV